MKAATRVVGILMVAALVLGAVDSRRTGAIVFAGVMGLYFHHSYHAPRFRVWGVAGMCLLVVGDVLASSNPNALLAAVWAVVGAWPAPAAAVFVIGLWRVALLPRAALIILTVGLAGLYFAVQAWAPDSFSDPEDAFWWYWSVYLVAVGWAWMGLALLVRPLPAARARATSVEAGGG